LRNATTPTFEKLTLFTLDLPLEGLTIFFGLKDRLIRTLRDLQAEFLTEIKNDLASSFLSLSSHPDRLLNLTTNKNDTLDLLPQEEAKKSKAKAASSNLNTLEGFEIPEVKLTKYRSLNRQGNLTDSARIENLFRLRGTLSLQVYLNVHEKTTVSELGEALSRDIEVQFERRLALLKEAVEENSKTYVSN
jgi:hypothetical protein